MRKTINHPLLAKLRHKNIELTVKLSLFLSSVWLCLGGLLLLVDTLAV